MGGPPAARGPPPRAAPMGGYPVTAPFPHPAAFPVAASSPDDPLQSTCLKARGIPYEATEEDVLKFFQQSGYSPVSLHRQQGEAFVEFARPEHATAAMQLHRGLIGTRYIELARCSYNEMARIVGLPLKEVGVVGGQRGMEGGWVRGWRVGLGGMEAEGMEEWVQGMEGGRVWWGVRYDAAGGLCAGAVRRTGISPTRGIRTTARLYAMSLTRSPKRRKGG